MKLKGLVPLCLSFFVGCAIFVEFNDAPFEKFYRDGSQLEITLNGEDKFYFYRIPIQDTNYFVEGSSFNYVDAKVQARNNLEEINSYGVSIDLLYYFDENKNFILEEEEHKNYCYIRRYFYIRIEK